MFQTVLFDIDGVMLSEERYFDASALTVYELLTSPQYLGFQTQSWPAFRPAPDEVEIRQIRQLVFAQDEVLQAMKQVGINANWDMVYLQTTFQLTQVLQQWRQTASESQADQVWTTLQDRTWTAETLRELGDKMREQGFVPALSFSNFMEIADACKSKSDLFQSLEAKLQAVVPSASPLADSRMLWHLGQQTFQEWYLGDEYVALTQQPGKPGFLREEQALIDPQKFAELLSRIKERGIELGIATGRPDTETRVPLEHMGWLGYFPESRISTASDVLRAEQAYPTQRPLAKPHPFSYLRSYLNGKNAQAVLAHALPLPLEEGGKILVVGDSVADLLAARSMGCKFAAVLTGLEGSKAKAQFERLGADFIFHDVMEVAHLLQ